LRSPSKSVIMVDGATLGTSQLVPPRNAGLLEKRLFEKRILPGISFQRGDSNTGLRRKCGMLNHWKQEF